MNRYPITISAVVPGIILAGIMQFSAMPIFASESGPGSNSDRKVATEDAFRKDVLPIVQKYCADCHGDSEPDGGVSLHDLTQADQVTENRDTWVRGLSTAWHRRDAAQRPRCSTDERERMVQWLDLKLFHVDCDVADDSGRVTIHRLNRTEYTNTIRDLLLVDVDVADEFPSDDVGYGFSNIADVLSLPPLLLEKYVDASEQIAAVTVLTESAGRQKQTFAADRLAVEGSAQPGSDMIVMPSNGTAVLKHYVRATGDYVVRVEAMADQAGPDPARMEIRIDGKAVKVHDIQGYREPAMYETPVHLKQGPRRIEAAFINDFYQPNAENSRDRDRNLMVSFIELQGPADAAPPASHQQLVFVKPSDSVSVEDAARQIFARLLPRAFRRSVSPEETDRFVRLVKLVTDRGDSFERGVQVALQGVLVSPYFLFRIEYDDIARRELEHSINDYELASRLSYFLWSTMPDDELFQLAEAGRLHQQDVLDAQIERMLKDPKADALVDNFASQWLTLSNLVAVQPSRELFPEFTPELRNDMLRETRMFISTIFREDRSLLDFLDADFTFVNERLAKHYGIEGISGNEFRRVSLPGETRTGVLTHASILTITSNPDRTSLVRRGAWILDQVVGMELPDPPANVPSLEEGAKKSGATSMREQLQIHREMPTCAACHDTLDPLGFGFENFDPIGRWRVEAEGKPVDAGGTLPSGDSFSGPVELAAILKKRRDEFAKLITKKMLTYALGRGLELPDSCTVDEIVDDLREQDYRFTVLVRGIIHSKPFLMRRPDVSEPTVTEKEQGQP